MPYLFTFDAVWTGPRPIKLIGELAEPFEVARVPPALYRERPGLSVRLLPVEDYARQVCERGRVAASWAKQRGIEVVGRDAHEVRRDLLAGIYPYDPDRWSLDSIPGCVDPDAPDLEQLKINDLRSLCAQRGLPQGTKDQMLEALQGASL